MDEPTIAGSTNKPEGSAPPEFLGANARFQVTRVLGVGGMGTVRQARDTMLRRDVAIKTVKPELAKNEEFTKRLERECLLHAKVGLHPHIVALFDKFEEEGRIHIVMEYVEGESLQGLLERHASQGVTLTAHHSLLICAQVLDALARIHANGIVHRDIKPSNIMVTREGSGNLSAKLMDFGIARADAISEQITHLTVTGSGPGTPLYMAPEQIDSPTYGPVTAATDIYAMGSLLYQMFSGKPPFRGTLTEVLHGHLQQAPPPLRNFTQGFGSPDLDAVLRRALAKRPVDRWPSAQAFRAELLRIDQDLQSDVAPVRDSQLPTAAMAPRAPTPTSSSDVQTRISSAATLVGAPRKTQATIIAAILAFVVLIAGGGVAAGWYLSHKSGISEAAAADGTYGTTPSAETTGTVASATPPANEAGSTPPISVPPLEPTQRPPTVPAEVASVAGQPGPTVPNVAAGQAIVEPPKPTSLGNAMVDYIVKPNESLSIIATMYTLDVRDLQWWNEIRDPNTLAVGQTLHLYKRPNLIGKDAFFASIPAPAQKPAPSATPTHDEPETVLAPSTTEQPKTEEPKKKKSGFFGRLFGKQAQDEKPGGADSKEKLKPVPKDRPSTKGGN